MVQSQNSKSEPEPDLPNLSGYSLNFRPEIEDIEAKYDPLSNQSEEHLDDEYEVDEADGDLDEEHLQQEQESELNEREGRQTRQSSTVNKNESPTRSERRRSDQNNERRRRVHSPGMPRGPRFSHLPEWQRVS